MKRLRKTAMAAALAASMLGTGVLPVFAEDTPAQSQTSTQTGSVKVTEVVEGLNYQAYQLFTGTFAKTPTTITSGLKDGSLSHELAKDENGKGLNTMGDVAFGTAAGQDGEFLIQCINEFMKRTDSTYIFAPTDDGGSTKAQKTADEIGKQEKLQTVDFANYVGMKIKQPGSTISAVATETPVEQNGTYNVTFDDLTSGYYLIMAETPAAPTPSEGATLAQTSAIMVPVAGNIEIHSKTSKPTVDKQVTDKADGSEWDSAASVGLIKQDGEGNLVLNGLSYKLTGTISNNVIDFAGDNHGTYKYEFIDTLPKGLKLKDGTDLPENWTQKVYLLNSNPGENENDKFEITDQINTVHMPAITTTAGKDGEQSTITWTWDNLLDVLKATGWDYGYSNAKNISVVVEYTPVYTADQIKAIFNAQSQTKDPQTNTVYVQFSNNPHNKGDLDRTPDDITRVYSFNLNLKKVDGDNKALNGAEFTLKDKSGKEAGKLIIKDGEVVSADITETPEAGKAQFTWTGLDADTEYTLTETKVPAGYKKIEDIKFTITPHFKDDANGNKELISVEANVTSGTSNSINKIGDSWMIDASLSGNVVNVQGPNMPITGQAGIWTGVTAGGAVIAISAYAVLKKKKEQE